MEEYYEIFSDCWDLFQDHATRASPDWDDIMEEAHRLCEKYPEKRVFILKLLIATVNELGRQES